MPRVKGTFYTGPNEMEYKWGKNKVEICSRIGPTLTFMLNTEKDPVEEPAQLAKDIYETAVIQGLIGEEGHMIRHSDFRVEGPSIPRGKTIMAILTSAVYPIPKFRPK